MKRTDGEWSAYWAGYWATTRYMLSERTKALRIVVPTKRLARHAFAGAQDAAQALGALTQPQPPSEERPA